MNRQNNNYNIRRVFEKIDNIELYLNEIRKELRNSSCAKNGEEQEHECEGNTNCLELNFINRETYRDHPGSKEIILIGYHYTRKSDEQIYEYFPPEETEYDKNKKAYILNCAFTKVKPN